jgi:4-amino-4-deoxy-L-arabinose transferase-like glycosyltransferase
MPAMIVKDRKTAIAGAAGRRLVVSTSAEQLSAQIFNQRMVLPLILILALALRLYYAVFLVGSVDTEGIEYARLAENLLAGHGYVGLATPGKELMFPPLFPILIAAVTLITHQSEIAGRAISVIMGTLLVVPVYLIAHKMYGRRSAQLAGLLVAVHPTLANISASVYCESTYFTLIMTAVYFALNSATLTRWWHFAACGTALGLSYLVRPEAAAFPVLFILLMAWKVRSADRERLWRTLRGCLLLAATFTVFAAPYIVWLSMQIGGLHFEGKGELNYAIAAAMERGQTEQSAMYGIDHDLHGTGVWMKTNLDVIRSVRFDPKIIFSIFSDNTVHNISAAADIVDDGKFLGSPILWGLVVLGLFGRRWREGTRAAQPYLFIVVAIPLLASITISHLQLQARYFLPFLPVMIIWAVNGLSHLCHWVTVGLKNNCWNVATSRRVARVVASVIIGMLLLVSAAGIEDDPFLRAFGRNSLPVKVAGEWLHSFAPGPITVMDASAVLAYHAKASFLFYPDTDEATALRYIAANKVNFLILQEKWLPHMGYARAWFDRGVPLPNAHLVYSVDTQGRGRIVIYQLVSQLAG